MGMGAPLRRTTGCGCPRARARRRRRRSRSGNHCAVNSYKEDTHMRYGTTMMTATVLTSLLAVAPYTAGAQSKMEQTKDKAKSTTQEAKTMVSDSWITSKTKIALFADERVDRKSTRLNSSHMSI